MGPSKCTILRIGILLLTCVLHSTVGDELRDVALGHDVTLECRFQPLSGSGVSSTLYWIRENRDTKDNVAIGETILDAHYRIDYNPDEGRYDLHISSATYERDDGTFECRMKEGGTGRELHTKTFRLTVLIPPEPPRISPNNVTVTENRPAQIKCSSVGGSPDPNIIWYRQGVPQPIRGVWKPSGNRDIPTESFLQIVPSKEDDGAIYRCIVESRSLDSGQKLETSVKLNVNYFPRIEVGPENPVYVEEGGSTKLVCKVDAKPAASIIKWTKKGQFLGSSFTYSLTHVRRGDAGEYTCSADNRLQKTGEGVVVVDILYAPLVSVESSREAEAGENVRIRCNATGNPQPKTVEWLKVGDPDFRQNGPVLSLNEVSAINSGEYLCRAVNYLHPTGAQKEFHRIGNATTKLLVKHAPGKTFIKAEERKAIVGESFTMTCEANPAGWPMPHYRWWKQGQENSPQLGKEYHFGKVRLSDEGLYYCEPRNNLGSGSQAFYELKVYEAPTLISYLDPGRVHQESSRNVNAMCTSKGKPKPTVHWFKDGEEIRPTSPFFEITVQEDSGQNNEFTVYSVLHFRGPERKNHDQLMPADRGNYTCEFRNDVGMTQTSMLLNVEHSPILMHQHNKVAYDIGDSAVVTCKMQAYPMPGFEWWFNKNPLNSGDHMYDMNITSLRGGIYQAALRINSVSENDYGEYTCRGMNSMGDLKTVIKLEPRGPPSEPTHLRVTETWSSQVTLRWDEGFNGGYPKTRFKVFVYSDQEKRGVDCVTYNPCNITGLTPQTSYMFRVRATNDKGDSSLSEALSASTAIDVSNMPKPSRTRFDVDDHTLFFTVSNFVLPLSAILEINGGEEVRHYDTIFVETVENKVAIADIQEHEMVQVRLCLPDKPSVCGDIVVAQTGPILASDVVGGLQPHYLIAIGVCSGIFFLLLCIFVVFCCRRKPKLEKKEYVRDTNITEVQTAPPPPYSPNGKVDQYLEHGDTSNNPLFHHDPKYGIMGNGYLPNGGVNMGYMDHSYSNSNNGSSVNSQDTLWHNKGSGEMPPHTHSVVYDPVTHGGYSAYDNFSNYPHIEDINMINHRNREYLANGDPYSTVNKGKKVDLLDEQFHGVSGLPDPYMEHECEENKTQHVSVSFDESLESGFSTPTSKNRRIIREIIV